MAWANRVWGSLICAGLQVSAQLKRRGPTAAKSVRRLLLKTVTMRPGAIYNPTFEAETSVADERGALCAAVSLNCVQHHGIDLEVQSAVRCSGW